MPSRKLVLMISSRADRSAVADGKGGVVSLSHVRKELKRTIEGATYLGGKLINVWINEEEVGGYAATSWEDCIKIAEDCDLFISLFDGSAGWSDSGNPGLGICQAEFETAHSRAPQKVALVQLANAKASTAADRAFLAALTGANLFRTKVGTSATAPVEKDEVIKGVLKVTRELLLKMAHEGVAQHKRSGPNLGQALDWSRMSFADRAGQIRKALTANLKSRPNAAAVGSTEMTVIEIGGDKLLVVPHAIPAAFGVPAAREMVGQPFLKDHAHIASLTATGAEAGIGGPIHIIGCSKSVTESQAISLLGFPDATIIQDKFGVYVADGTHKIQLCLIANCVDAASTAHGLQRLFDWLQRSGERDHLVRRAKARRVIVDSILTQL